MSDDGLIDFDQLSIEKIQRISRQLDAASRCGIGTLRHLLSYDKVDALFKRVTKLLKLEPTVLDLQLTDPEVTVTVVGDTHGQFHDVLHMFEVVGFPSNKAAFVFNGDFVDRGSWGLETLVLFLCWKLLLPSKVFLIRGNHESQLMTELYGYKSEVEAKYSRMQSRTIYAASKKLFSVMPLAIVIQEKTLVCHGGLFRALQKRCGRKRKKTKPPIEIGTLSMLRSLSKGGLEPSATKVAQPISDVLWSDPVPEFGVTENLSRGLGLVFGPDVTDAFLAANGLKLIIRSHEGPDARIQRSDVADMMTGFAVDHDVSNGKLITVFSAPDYPQFQEGNERTNNAAAVVVLSYPDYTTPKPINFNAVQPRPSAPVFYDLDLNADTDIDFNEVYNEDSPTDYTEMQKDDETKLVEEKSMDTSID